MFIMSTSGIYKIQSIVHPERCYIGSALRVRDRWKLHLKQLKENKHHSKKLQRHYNKYGESDLIFSIIEPCLPQFLTVIEDTYFHPLPYFNICPKAGSTLGLKMSEESRNKMKGNKNGIGNKGKGIGHIPWNKGKAGIINTWNKGKKTGIIPSNAFKKGHSTWNKGMKMPEDIKQKMRKPRSEEFKKIMRTKKNGLGHKHSEESIVKMVAAKILYHKQHPMTEETRNKMSIAAKKRKERERILRLAS